MVELGGPGRIVWQIEGTDQFEKLFCLSLFANNHCLIIPHEWTAVAPDWSEVYNRYVVDRETVDGDIAKFLMLSTNPCVSSEGELSNVFDECRHRTAKPRTSYSMQIELE